MSEQFKEKLKKYAEGKLTEDERREIEYELDKMESYQQYLDEMMIGQEEIPNSKSTKVEPLGANKRSKNERGIIRRAKWKARFMSTLFLPVLIFLLFIILSLLNIWFYSAGEPARSDQYRNTIISTVAMTKPNTNLSINTNAFFFFMNNSGDLVKRVGDTYKQVGDFSMRFFMGLPLGAVTSWTDSQNQSSYIFRYPNEEAAGEMAAKGTKLQERVDEAEWDRLEKLPIGTVAEASISFDRYFSTAEISEQLSSLSMEVNPLWFAVDTGQDSMGVDGNVNLDPVGFPLDPFWNPIDRPSSSASEYGDAPFREAAFIKGLELIQKHKSIANRIDAELNVEAVLQYVEQNGIRIYGAVITGPTKELLKLRQEDWITDLRVEDVELWNWHS